MFAIILSHNGALSIILTMTNAAINMKNAGAALFFFVCSIVISTSNRLFHSVSVRLCRFRHVRFPMAAFGGGAYCSVRISFGVRSCHALISSLSWG